jgi:hypothetical protein
LLTNGPSILKIIKSSLSTMSALPVLSHISDAMSRIASLARGATAPLRQFLAPVLAKLKKLPTEERRLSAPEGDDQDQAVEQLAAELRDGGYEIVPVELDGSVFMHAVQRDETLAVAVVPPAPAQ